MPELPEVETVARQLAPVITGRQLRRLEILDSLLDADRPERVVGRTVRACTRVGKQVVLDLGRSRGADRDLWLCVHLRMTGRLLAIPRATGRNGKRAATPTPVPHLRARFELVGAEVQFIDPRRFGTIRLHTDPAAFAPAGVDPTKPEFTVERLATLIDGSRTPIKPWLLRQDRIVGIGNIYASEILFRAAVAPQRPAASLTAAEVARVHTETVTVLAEAIDACGTTFSDFQDAHGVTGSYQQFLRVYQREGEPCPVCATPIQRLLQQQRSTFWCPTCQPARRSRKRKAAAARKR